MFLIVLSTILAFALTFFTVPVIICLGQNIRIHDIPDHRKIHVAPKPSLGGLGIFIGLVFTVMFLIPFAEAAEFQYFIAAAFVLFFIGMKDDLDDLSPFKKIIGQGLAAFLIIYKGGLQLTSMYGILGVHELTGLQSLLLTYFSIIVITNAINLIDGVDGLAGSLGLMVSTVLGCYFLDVGLHTYAVFSFALAGSLLAFLIFNFQPSKIFMGDTGSLVVGLICAILTIKFINISATHAIITSTAAPALGFTLLMVPLLDCLRVFGTRILRRRSPFSPDKNHIHHLLLAAGLSHRRITVSLVAINLFVLLGCYAIRNIGNTGMIAIVSVTFFTGTSILKQVLRRKHRRLHKTIKEEKLQKLKSPIKIVTLANNLTMDDGELVKNI